ncbi:MAG: hypothetical protein LBC94_08460 [Desulfovibrio sp.]|nr:hypothetical protein [Desulfovibrio sp.]
MNGATDPLSGSPTAVRQYGIQRFLADVREDIARIARGCNELTLVCAELVDRRKLGEQLGAAALASAESALTRAMLLNMKECDRLGRLAEGRHALLLPGVGSSGARLHGENLQKAFADDMNRREDKSLKIACALGIVCVGRDEAGSAQSLLERGNRALRKALEQQSVYICQERLALSERPTLVHSNEKRFLFFGEG